MTDESVVIAPRAPERFIGGMRGPRVSWLEPGANATWPLVELRVRDGRGSLRVRLPGLRSLVQRWLPSFEFDAATVRAQTYSGWIGRGVLLEPPEGPSVIFWTSKPEAVLAAIAQQGSSAER